MKLTEEQEQSAAKYREREARRNEKASEMMSLLKGFTYSDAKSVISQLQRDLESISVVIID